MYLFDTDTLSEVLKRAHRSPKRDELLRLLRERVWPHVRILPFDRAAVETYGALRAQLERGGTSLSEPDMRIAAIALTHNLTVVTDHTRHFQRVGGLRVENWM